MSRDVVVGPARLTGWFDGFFARNGDLASITPSSVGTVVKTARGATAVLRGYHGEVADLDHVIRGLLPDADCAVALIRRGGFSIARATACGADFTVTASKTGSRYVQGRTAAGGQSQQRFARRRDNQAAALVQAALAAARSVLGDHPAPVDLLITGGDHLLLDDAFDRRPLRDLKVKNRIHVEVGEPRRTDVDRAIELARSVTITVTNADPNADR